jgi:hypothetical protein
MTVYWIIAILAGAVLVWLALRRFESMSRYASAELRGYFARSGDELFWRNALRELRRRGEDVSFARNAILNLLLSDELQDRVIGWACLMEAFPGEAATLDFDHREPSAAVLDRIRELKRGRGGAS